MLNSETADQQLREISQQGMKKAAEMFSQLVQQPVSIEVVDAWMSDRVKTGKNNAKNGIGVYMGISGELSGGLLFFLVEDCATWLAGKLLNDNLVNDLLTEPTSSTLKEIGNIISSAFLASLDDQMGIRSLPTPPVLSRGTVSELVKRYQHDRCEPCLVVRTRFTSGDAGPAELLGENYLFLSRQTMKQLIARFATR